jgi:predicted permease
MRKLRALLIRLRDLLSFHRGEDDFAAELESHVEMHIEDGIRAGLSPEEARRQALIRLGGAEQTRQAYRERRGLPWLETFWQDLRFAARMLAKSPGFTAVAVLTLAFGIGVNSTVFTVAEAALLRSWPAQAPERLARIISTTPQGQEYSLSYPDYQDLVGQSRTLQGVLAYARHSALLRIGAESQWVLDDVVSPNYFTVLGLNPQLGRTFSADAGTHGELSVVISDSLWRRAFHADPSLVGKQIQLTGGSYTVLGIAPPGFRGLTPEIPTELWLPVSTAYGNADLADRKYRDFEVLGRLRPGVTATQAKADLDTLGRRLAQTYPATDKARNVTLISEQERLREAVAPTLFLMTTVGLVLLICCANVAGLVLARADARRREIAVRLALGAKRLRLVRQLLTESLLLAVTGAVLGLLLAVGLFRLQPALLPPTQVTIGLDLHLDAFVLTYTAVLSVLTVLVFGLAPAIQASKASCVSALKGEERSMGRSVRRLTLRNALVLGEIALSVLLLTASGLVVRSLLFSSRIPLGFDRQKHLVFFDIIPGIAGYNPQRSAAFFAQVEARAVAMPGVRHASVVQRVLLSDSGGGAREQVSIPGVELSQGQPNIPIRFNVVDSNYFQTMGTRLMEGRAFTSSDNRSAESVVIVSKTMASRFWPGQEALGRQIVVEGKASQIVGIAEDVKIFSIHEDPEPYMYFPFAQRSDTEATLIVEAENDTRPLVDRIRSEIRSVDPKVPVDVRTLSYLMRQAFWIDQIEAGSMAALGLLAIFIGTLGLYGVVSYVVNRRKQEIAIRMALGAERRDIVRLVLGQGLALAAVGTGVGLVASFAATRLMATMLYGVRPTDPIAFAGSAALVILVALAASWIPARRAASVDPMQALRTE